MPEPSEIHTGVPVIIKYRMFEVLDVEHGRWCDRCLLPSAEQVWLVTQVYLGGILQPMRLWSGTRCGDCETWEQAPL